MEIPKMKIFIYALTFLGYAWSGYGADFIQNVRDAVLSAENLFGGVLQNAVTVINNFRNIRDVLNAAVDETCEFSCPSGSPPVPNRGHKPTSDGCGSYGIPLNDHLHMQDMTKCCDEHDICYDTCNSSKEKCDFAFQRCLFSLCEKKSIESLVTSCKAASKMLFHGTFTLGCKAYQDSQKKACYCKTVKKSKFRGDEL